MRWPAASKCDLEFRGVLVAERHLGCCTCTFSPGFSGLRGQCSAGTSWYTVSSWSSSGTWALLVQDETQEPGKGNKRLGVILPVKEKLKKKLESSAWWDYWDLCSVKERRGPWPNVLAGDLLNPWKRISKLKNIQWECNENACTPRSRNVYYDAHPTVGQCASEVTGFVWQAPSTAGSPCSHSTDVPARAPSFLERCQSCVLVPLSLSSNS